MAKPAKEICIHNISMVCDFLHSITKIVPSGRFNITNQKCSVNAYTLDKTGRMYFNTNSITAIVDDGEYIEFNFKDISNLIKSLKLINSIEQIDSVVLKFDNKSIIYKNEVKFKLKTVEAVMLDEIYTNPITVELKSLISIDTSINQIKQVLRNLSIVCLKDDDVKVYLTQKPDSNIVIAELDDRLNTYQDSIGIPIGTTTNQINELLCVKITTFRDIGVVESDKINISYTDKKVLEITSKIEDNGYYTSLRGIMPLLKN